MHLINVVCSNCGTLLSIPEEVKHATCNGCETPFSVRQTDTITFTEPMLLARPEHLAVVPFEEEEPVIPEEEPAYITDNKIILSELEQWNLANGKELEPVNQIDNEEIKAQLKSLDEMWAKEKKQFERENSSPANYKNEGLIIFGIVSCFASMILFAQGVSYLSIMAVVVFFGGIGSWALYYANVAYYFERKKAYENERIKLESQLR